jgi:hypothetical protein
MAIDIANRQRTLMILWFILLMSLGLLFVLSLSVAPEISGHPGNQSNSVFIVVLTALGIFLVIISFVVKRRFLAQSVEKQDVRLVPKALIIAFAMCEASALLGLLEHFVIGNREYYFLFLLAAAGFLLHFPRREHLIAASPKIPIGGASS